MTEYFRRHAATSPAGVLTLVTWSLYVICIVALYYPNFLASLLIAAFFGVLACAAVIFNFRYWRATVLLSSFVYLVVYAVRIIRMTAMTADTPFLPAVSSYYQVLWQVTLGVFQEKGTFGGLAQIFHEYVIPVLILALIVLVLVSRRRVPSGAPAG